MKLQYTNLMGLYLVLTKIKSECNLTVIKALKLKRAFKKITEETKLYNELHEELLDKYAKQDDTGNRILKEVNGSTFFMIEDMASFQSEMEELSKQEFEVDDVYLSEEDLSSMKLTMDDLDALEPFMQEPSKPE